MTRIEIDILRASLMAAYRHDRMHSFLGNAGPVTDAQWDLRPAEYSVEVFGARPELSIRDLVHHVGAGFLMYRNKAFGDGSLTWDQIQPPGGGKEATLAWLDEHVTAFADALEGLPEDGALAEERAFFGGMAFPVRWYIQAMTSHLLYHSGEVNRQLSLIRGANGGWVGAHE